MRIVFLGLSITSSWGNGHATNYRALVRELSRRGVILAVCSKNDEANALEPFERHPDMVLRRDDIACAYGGEDRSAIRGCRDLCEGRVAFGWRVPDTGDPDLARGVSRENLR